MFSLWIIPIIFLRPEVAAILLRTEQVPAAIAFLTMLTGLTLLELFNYFVWGSITANTLSRWKRHPKREHQCDSFIFFSKIKKSFAPLMNKPCALKNKIIQVLSRQNIYVVYLILCLPIPYLGTFGPIVLRTMQIKYRVRGLIITSNIRAALMVAGVYFSFSLFGWG